MCTSYGLYAIEILDGGIHCTLHVSCSICSTPYKIASSLFRNGNCLKEI